MSDIKHGVHFEQNVVVTVRDGTRLSMDMHIPDGDGPWPRQVAPQAPLGEELPTHITIRRSPYLSLPPERHTVIPSVSVALN